MATRALRVSLGAGSESHPQYLANHQWCRFELSEAWSAQDRTLNGDGSGMLGEKAAGGWHWCTGG